MPSTPPARTRSTVPASASPTRLTVTSDNEYLATADVIVLAVPSAGLRTNLDAPRPGLLPRRHHRQRHQGHRDRHLPAHVAGYRGLRRRTGAHPRPLRPQLRRRDRLRPARRHRRRRHRRRLAPEQVQALLSGPTFRVYTSDDITGVELGGALKNVVAIACGMSDGLGYGENAKAALITRGLAEIIPPRRRHGRQAPHLPRSRRHRRPRPHLRERPLAQPPPRPRPRPGVEPRRSPGSLEGVVEGVVTARAIPQLVAKYGVDHADLRSRCTPSSSKTSPPSKPCASSWRAPPAPNKMPDHPLATGFTQSAMLRSPSDPPLRTLPLASGPVLAPGQLRCLLCAFRYLPMLRRSR